MVQIDAADASRLTTGVMSLETMEPIEAYARYKCGKLSSDSIVSLANSWLDAGIYAPSLGDLFNIPSPSMSEVGPLFESVMDELNIEKLSRVDSAKLIIKNTLSGIVEGQIDPVEGASFLYWDIHQELTEEMPDKEYLGDNLGLEHVFCWLREIWDCGDGSMILYYADLPRPKAEAKFHEHLVEESAKLLTKLT